MDKFRAVLGIANQQNNLCFGLVALLTAGGEHIFSSAVFRCPCNELNFVYGMVFLLVPALALLLLGYILSRRTWKLLTGVCRRRAALCRWRRLAAAGVVLFQISTTALVAPSSWIAVALLNGNYYECLMTGASVRVLDQHLCRGRSSQADCEKDLHRLPCAGTGSRLPQAEREEVLLVLRAQSQILGWLLIASVMLSNLLLTCVARCTSPISSQQLKFWRVYAQEEGDLIDAYTTEHAKQLAERNLKSFFNKTAPEPITTPSSKDWEKISSLYKFSTTEQYYSTLHRYVENCQESGDGMMRLVSIRSGDTADNPAVLHFVDEGRIAL